MIIKKTDKFETFCLYSELNKNLRMCVTAIFSEYNTRVNRVIDYKGEHILDSAQTTVYSSNNLEKIKKWSKDKLISFEEYFEDETKGL